MRDRGARAEGSPTRHVPLESAAELLALLEEAGVRDAPREGPTDHELQGLLALAYHLVERQKEVSFDGFTWDDPRFVARDEKIEVTLLHGTLDGRTPADVASAFEQQLARPHPPRTLLALDARGSGITEFELGHHLYGEVTLHAHRVRIPEPKDPRIHQARDRGWVKTLKEHNLLPGRGLVVTDEKHGLYLTDPVLEDAVGALVLLPTNQAVLLLNPFAGRPNEPDLQHWLAWGRGTAGSEWRQLLDVSERDDAYY